VAEGFTVGRLGEFETNGRWQLVRRGLGVESFGLNVVEIEQGYSIPSMTRSSATRRKSSSSSRATR